MSPRLREVLFVLQFVGNIIVLGLIVGLLLTASNNIARTATAQTEANRQILNHLQRVFIVHANASTKQNCAVASEIAFLVESSPLAPQKLIDRVNHFVHTACKIEVVPPLAFGSGSGSSPPTLAPNSGEPGSSPSGGGIPSGGPTGSPSVSPSPTLICLPDIGCL